MSVYVYEPPHLLRLSAVMQVMVLRTVVTQLVTPIVSGLRVKFDT